MGSAKEKLVRWMVEFSEQKLRFISLLLMVSTLLAGHSGLGTMTKTVIFSSIMLSWILMGIVYLVKWNQHKKSIEKKPG